MDTCFYCGDPASTRCSFCNLVSYCQNDHLKIHRPKTTCFPFKVERTPEKGSHLIAVRRIKPMEVILEEYPVVCGPYSNAVPSCLECFKRCSDGSYLCSQCNFPLCGPDCEKGPRHQVECQVFQKCGYKCPSITDYTSKSSHYAPITALRTLALRHTSPRVWSIVKRLLDHNDKRKKDEAFERNRKDIGEFIADLIPDLSADDVMKVVGVILTNNANLDMPDGFSKATGLYAAYCMANHSCICNTKTIKYSDYRLELRALVSIQAGEEISNQYMKPDKGTLARRLTLKNKWYFECACKRCADPTECESYLSAILCTECKGGVVLPQNSLDFESDWECEDCQTEYSVDFIADLIMEAEAFIEDVPEGEEDIVTHYEKFLDGFSQRLHQNHYLMIGIKMKLGLIYGNFPKYAMESLPRPLLQRKIQCCQDVLDTLSKVDMGYSDWRAKMLHESIRTRVHVARSAYELLNLEDADPKEGIDRAEALKKVLNEQKFLQMYLAYHHSVFFPKK